MTELTWERGKKAKDLYNVGDEVQAYILKVDRDTKKISLSLKRAQPEKWDTTVNRFVIGQILIGRVTKLMAFGAFVRLDGPVEGLIHISELSNRRIQHPKDVVKEGDVVPVKLVRIEKDRHRLGLSLRQARNDAEAMGFVFDAQRRGDRLPGRRPRAVPDFPPRDKSVAAARAASRVPRRKRSSRPSPATRSRSPRSRTRSPQALENAEAGSPFARPQPKSTPLRLEAVAAARGRCARRSPRPRRSQSSTKRRKPVAEETVEAAAAPAAGGSRRGNSRDSSEATAEAPVADNGAYRVR